MELANYLRGIVPGVCGSAGGGIVDLLLGDMRVLKEKQIPNPQHCPEKRRKGNSSAAGKMDKHQIQAIAKLCEREVWAPRLKTSMKHQSLIIFDWDDTLLCTSFLRQAGQREIPPDTQLLLACIESFAHELLETAINLGRTLIITNAMEGWVESSAAQHMPSLVPILEKVSIVSARSKHEAESNGDMAQWKRLAFLDLHRQFPLDGITNLVSIGDSDFELEAARLLCEQLDQSLLKTVKFMERPSPLKLMKQLEMLSDNFQYIVGDAQEVSIHMDVKKPVKPV